MWQVLMVFQGSAECAVALVACVSSLLFQALPKVGTSFLISVSLVDEQNEGMSEYEDTEQINDDSDGKQMVAVQKREMQGPVTIVTMMLLCDSDKKMVTMATLMVRAV